MNLPLLNPLVTMLRLDSAERQPGRTGPSGRPERAGRSTLVKLMATFFLLLLTNSTHAGQRITGIGQYRMSDRESDEQAKQIALDRALQQARERAGLFQVASVSRHATTEWANGSVDELYEQQTGIRSEVRLRIVGKSFAPVEEQVRSSVDVGGRKVFFEDQVRYWTCAVDVEVVEIVVEVEPMKRPMSALAVQEPASPDALEEQPVSLESRLLRAGLECMLRGQWGPARDLFSQRLREDPANGDALYLLAFCLEKSGDQVAFRQVLRTAVRQHPHKSIHGVLQANLAEKKVQQLML